MPLKPLFALIKAVVVSLLFCISSVDAFSETRESKKAPQSNMIPFESPNQLEGYQISGFWFPEDKFGYSGLRGPAIFVFTKYDSGETYSVAVNSIALLNKEFYDSNNLTIGDDSDIKQLIEKLKGYGILPLHLDNERRAKIKPCKRYEDDILLKSLEGDQCLMLGDAPVDMQDIDFDGEKEVIFRQEFSGQRSGEAYEIMKLPYEKYEQSRFRNPPLSEIDFLTIIDVTKKQIVIDGSNGVCAETAEIYSSVGNGDFKMTRFRRFAAESRDQCNLEDYSVHGQLDGVGRCLKLSSRKKME
jgi:hypothetical protein